MDALSHLLRSLHVVRATFTSAELTAPWVTQSATEDDGAHGLALYFVLEGSCTLHSQTHPPTALHEADAVLLPSAGRHRLVSAASAQPVPGQGASRLVCAQVALDAALSRQMVHLLPPVVTVRLDPPAQAAWRQVCAWLGRGLNLDAEPGTHGVLAKAAELLLIEVVRRHFTAAGDSLAASARGLQDRAVGSCLAAIHERPADPWTVERLARRAHTSRSVLAERFKQLVGTSPMNYLTQCRMTRAARLLRDSTLPLARVAEEVGYETDTAFSRAFRREFGLPPAAWRRAQAAATK